MKKVFFTTVLFILINTVWSQSNSYIFVNPTATYQGAQYSVPDGSGSYSVLKSNTLYSIAKMHGMSVSELKELNNLYSNTIQVGQILKVKQTTILGSGLSLNTNGVASNYSGVSESTIKQDLASSNHAVWGRAATLKGEGQDIESLKGTHVTRDGDVLWYVAGDNDSYHTIATVYDMSFDTLKMDNEMNDYYLQSGMVMIVNPGKLYGMKEMPIEMPELKEEEVLTAAEAAKMVATPDVIDGTLEQLTDRERAKMEETPDVIDGTKEMLEEVKEDVQEEVEDAVDSLDLSQDSESVEVDW